jgi:hypothetical protein
MNIRDYVRQLADDYKAHTSAVGVALGTDEYMGPHVRSMPRPTPWYMCHR